MIVGSGLIASAFSSYPFEDDTLLFASGVSNSKENRPEAFQRELDLLQATILNNPDKKIIYFSTVSVLDPELASELYVKHKLNCESFLRTQAKDYLVLRVTNVVGKSGNPATIFNYFKSCIQNDICFDLWTSACRNFIDIEDLVQITAVMIEENFFGRTITVANPISYHVIDIVKQIENALGKKAVYRALEKGSCFTPDLAEIIRIYERNEIRFSDDYLSRLIARYLA